MTKVTYWFGAGASAQVHPTINNFIEKVEESRKDYGFPSEWHVSGADITEVIRFISKTLFKPLLKILKSSTNFGTIDTLAKYYMITDHTMFSEMKKLLQMYFLCEDFIRNKIDNRYLGLLTSISHDLTVSNNINFITWNYDSQLYKAKAFLMGKPFTVPSWGPSHSFDDSGSVVYHLNGTSFDLDVYREFYSEGIYFDTKNPSIGNVAQKIIDGYHNGYTNSIKYTFEEGRKDLEEIMSHLDARITGTQILIIIGYSFPFSNRFTDSQILSRLGSIEKIYVQDKNAQSVIDRVVQLTKNTRIVDVMGKTQIPIIPITDTESFYIPYEI